LHLIGGKRVQHYQCADFCVHKLRVQRLVEHELQQHVDDDRYV